MLKRILTVATVLLTLSACASQSGIYRQNLVTYGRIINIYPLQMQGGCSGTDVAIGAAAGALAQRGNSTGAKFVGAGVGAGVSCGIVNAMGWHTKTVYQYNILLRDGSVLQVVTDPQPDVVVTDCLEIGYVGNQVTSLAIIDPNIGCQTIPIPNKGYLPLFK